MKPGSQLKPDTIGSKTLVQGIIFRPYFKLKSETHHFDFIKKFYTEYHLEFGVFKIPL